MTSDNRKPTTNDAGIPVSSDEHSLSVGPDGPLVLHDHYLIEKMMAKEVEIRFQDPRDLAAEVDAVLQQRRSEQERQQDRPTLGRRRADRERSSRRRRRR